MRDGNKEERGGGREGRRERERARGKEEGQTYGVTLGEQNTEVEKRSRNEHHIDKALFCDYKHTMH